MTKKETKKGQPGQPTKLNEDISKLIIDDVREFLSINYASEAHNTPRSTVQSWIVKGRDDLELGKENIFTRFSQGIKKARAEYVQLAVKDIRNGVQSWQGTAWLLERCCAEDFGKDSELYKQLLEDYKMLMQSIVDQNKGINHGNETTHSKAV